jgi:hypothetical protein
MKEDRGLKSKKTKGPGNIAGSGMVGWTALGPGVFDPYLLRGTLPQAKRR